MSDVICWVGIVGGAMLGFLALLVPAFFAQVEYWTDLDRDEDESDEIMERR